MRSQDVNEARALLEPACPGITDRDTRLLLGLGLLACHAGRIATFGPLGTAAATTTTTTAEEEEDERPEPFSGLRVRMLPGQRAVLVVDPSSRFVGRRFSV